jgi:hypothetical protein
MKKILLIMMILSTLVLSAQSSGKDWTLSDTGTLTKYRGGQVVKKYYAQFGKIVYFKNGVAVKIVKVK